MARANPSSMLYLASFTLIIKLEGQLGNDGHLFTAIAAKRKKKIAHAVYGFYVSNNIGLIDSSLS